MRERIFLRNFTVNSCYVAFYDNGSILSLFLHCLTVLTVDVIHCAHMHDELHTRSHRPTITQGIRLSQLSFFITNYFSFPQVDTQSVTKSTAAELFPFIWDAPGLFFVKSHISSSSYANQDKKKERMTTHKGMIFSLAFFLFLPWLAIASAITPRPSPEQLLPLRLFSTRQ